MHHISLVFIVFIVLVSSCKKEDKSPAVPEVKANELTDFALIPVSDATWQIHTQGILTNEGKVDTSYHAYTTITATGVDTLVNGLRFFKYNVNTQIDYKLNPPPVTNSKYNVFIREDTLARTVRIAKGDFQEAPVVSFRDEEVGSIVNEKPQMEIKYVDSIIVANQYLKRWVACNSYDRNLEWFYKSYGMCTQTGILLRDMVVQKGGQVIETVFTYKNSTQKFRNDIVF